MRFISPKTDFAFKKIFGSAGSQGILRSFLNGVLYEGADRIASLVIVDPYSIPRLEGMKDLMVTWSWSSWNYQSSNADWRTCAA